MRPRRHPIFMCMPAVNSPCLDSRLPVLGFNASSRPSLQIQVGPCGIGPLQH